VALGILAGLATGTVLGILFAPDKGTDTRKKIANKSKDSLEDLKAKYNDVIDSLTSKLEAVKKQGYDLYNDGKDVAENANKEI
ncbi:MAG TPA: YtxH domain-containing protein, partial [Flavobacterium sp.]